VGLASGAPHEAQAHDSAGSVQLACLLAARTAMPCAPLLACSIIAHVRGLPKKFFYPSPL